MASSSMLLNDLLPASHLGLSTDSSAAYRPPRRGFTQSEEGRWDYGRRTGSRTCYNDEAYPSASAALEAYISDHDDRQERWRMKARYARDVEDLLIARCTDSLMSGDATVGSRTALTTQEDLRRHLAIRRLVDESYDKLDGQQVEPPTVDKAATLATDRLGNGADNEGSRAALEQKLLSHSQLESIKSRLRNRDFTVSGLHSAHSARDSTTNSKTSLDSDPGDSSAHPGPEHVRSHPQRHLLAGSGDASRSTETLPRRCTTPPLSQAYTDPDDTMTQLLSSRKAYSVANIPSWVHDLDTTESSHHGDNSTILTGLGQRPLSKDNKAISTPVLATRSQSTGRTATVPTAPLLTTPKKQLRFDLDLSQSALSNTVTDDHNNSMPKLRSSVTGDILPSVASERLMSYASGSPLSSPRAGILKSPSKREKSKNQDVSFTTEDISLGTMQLQRRRDFREKSRPGHHLRSFSASGRLSSTPIKSGLGSSQAIVDRPQISEISSVHTASSAPSSVTGEGPAPAKYLYKERDIKYDPVLDLYKVNNEKVPKQPDSGTSAPLGRRTGGSAADVAYARYCSKYPPLPPEPDSDKHRSTPGVSTTTCKLTEPTGLTEGYFVKSSPHMDKTSLPSSCGRVSVATQPDVKASSQGISSATIPLSNTSADNNILPSTLTKAKEPASSQVPDPLASVAKACDDISSTHKHYLQNLMRDIEDGSSTVVTSVPELQELLSPLGAVDDLPCDGLRTPSEASDAPLRASGLEETADSDGILDGDRSWEKYVNRPRTYQRKMAATANDPKCPEFHHKKGGIVEKFLRECHELQTETEKVLDGSSVSLPRRDVESHGTMEALKNMLFTMQSMTSADDLLSWTPEGDTAGPSQLTHRDNFNLTASDKGAVSADGLSPSTKLLLAADRGGDSLERALMHLNRLKSMVKGQKDPSP